MALELALKILNCGCGQAIDRRAGVVNVDTHPYPGVDVCLNLGSDAWPWAERSVDEIRAIQMYEHLGGDGAIWFMREAWRVLRPGADLVITTPHWRSENSYTDPTHRLHCTENSWGYWTAGHHLQAQFGPVFGSPPAVFASAKVTREGDDLRAVLTK